MRYKIQSQKDVAPYSHGGGGATVPPMLCSMIVTQYTLVSLSSLAEHDCQFIVLHLHFGLVDSFSFLDLIINSLVRGVLVFVKTLDCHKQSYQHLDYITRKLPPS